MACVTSAAITAIVHRDRVPVPVMARKYLRRRRMGRRTGGHSRERIIAIWGCVAMPVIMGIVRLLLVRRAESHDSKERRGSRKQICGSKVEDYGGENVVEISKVDCTFSRFS